MLARPPSRGGVIGGAGGAVIGGASGSDAERGRSFKIGEDLREKGIEGKIIPDGSLASGFIYFPGEAPTVRELRLQVRFRGSGAVETLFLKLH